MNGVINIFKPKGMTSFDVVREVKKVCSTGKVGHTGTLDPEATGVLPVCIGRATKIIDYIMDSRKVYEVDHLAAHDFRCLVRFLLVGFLLHAPDRKSVV